MKTRTRSARGVLQGALCAAGMVVVAATGVAAQQFPANPAVDRIFAEWDKPETPGCALGVVQNGKFIYERGYGMANLDYDIPNSPRFVYYIGSDSKQFTATSIALLVLQGKISLDDDIRKYIPELPDYGTPITISHLLHHTAGIRDMYVLMDLAGKRMEDVFTDDEALALIARQKELNFKPGDEYLYSNSNYWLLGQIVKRVTGESLRVFANDQIFQPLGMSHTHFHDEPGHIMKNRAMSYEPDSSGGYRISYLQNFDKIGAGGVYSSVEDLLKWDHNWYSWKVGGEALHRLMLTRGVLNNGDTITYAFANNITTYRGLNIIEHGGALMGYRAEILRFPDQHFSVLETCNLGTIDPGRLAFQVADIYLASKMSGPAPAARRQPRQQPAESSWTPAAADLAAFAGDYYSDELDVTYHVTVDGDHLLMKRRLDQAPLQPTSQDTFSAHGLTFHFERGTGGDVTAFTVEAGRVQHIRFTRR
jgi:CubicO group peptidase (beta-lactamase class C family)